MPRRLKEVPPEELASLLLDYLRKVEQSPDLTVGRLREQFALEKDLTPGAVRAIDNILWFGDFVGTAYRGLPPRPYRVLKPKGKEALSRGRLLPEDFVGVPWWVARWAKRRLPTLVIPPKPVLYMPLGDFGIWVEEDWGYNIYVETPTEDYWPPSRTIDPVEAARAGIRSYGVEYSPKRRAIAFLEVSGILPYGLIKHKWLRFSGPAEERPTRLRYHRILDPDGKIIPHRLPSPPGKIRWRVDFSEFAEHLPGTFPIGEAKARIEAKVPARPVRIVSGVFER